MESSRKDISSGSYANVKLYNSNSKQYAIRSVNYYKIPSKYETWLKKGINHILNMIINKKTIHTYVKDYFYEKYIHKLIKFYLDKDDLSTEYFTNIIDVDEQIINGNLQLLIVMELMNGDLTYLKPQQTMTDKTLSIMLLPIASGLKQLHDLNLVYSDLKLDNILLANRQVTHKADESRLKTDANASDSHENAHNLEVKVADFGLSVFLNRGETSKAVGGSTSYMAPEVWNNQNIIGEALDVW